MFIFAFYFSFSAMAITNDMTCEHSSLSSFYYFFFIWYSTVKPGYFRFRLNRSLMGSQRHTSPSASSFYRNKNKRKTQKALSQQKRWRSKKKKIWRAKPAYLLMLAYPTRSLCNVKDGSAYFLRAIYIYTCICVWCVYCMYIYIYVGEYLLWAFDLVPLGELYCQS